MAKGSGHDKSPARACRARPARAADSPRSAPTRPCPAGMGRPGRPAPRPVPIRSAYQTPLPSAAYASSRRHKLRSFASACGESSSAPLCLLSPQSLKGGFAGAHKRLRFLASPLPHRSKCGALLAGEEPFSAVYHILGKKYSFFCRGGNPMEHFTKSSPQTRGKSGKRNRAPDGSARRA